MEKMHIQAEVSGTVQGVGYRNFCQQQALRLHITGSVSNQSNDKVLIDAFGRTDSVLALIEQLKQGPSCANVARVSIKASHTEIQQGFDIH